MQSNSIYMAELTPSARQRGADGAILFYSEPVPKWYTCPAEEFIRCWLPQFESGALPKPTQAELGRLDKSLLAPAPNEPINPSVIPSAPPVVEHRNTVTKRAGGRPQRISDDQIVAYLERSGASSTLYAAKGLGFHWKNLARRMRTLEADGRVEKAKDGNRLKENGRDYIFWKVTKQ